MAVLFRSAKRASAGLFFWLTAMVMAAYAVPARTPVAPQPTSPAHPMQSRQALPLSLPLAFEPNLGQADALTQFLAHGPGYAVSLDASGARIRTRTPAGKGRPPASRFTMRWVAANPKAVGRGESPLPGRVNYFLGADPAHWHRDIPTYSRVAYRSVYPGTDLVYYGNQGQMEFDFVLAPGADPGLIRMAFDGTVAPRLSETGDLGFAGEWAGLVFKKPVAYQEIGGAHKAVDAAFVLAGREVGFRVGAYDPSRPLIIDPIVNYSTFLGSTSDDAATAVVADNSGNRFVAGNTQGANNFTSVTTGVKDSSPGTWDVWVMEIDAVGTSVGYSAFIGGTGDDFATGIAIDGSGNAYITGSTKSTKFPGALGGLQGAQDAFVLKLSACPPSGTPGLCTGGGALLYSNLLGGTDADVASAIRFYPGAVGNDVLYVAGSTASRGGICSPAGQGDGFIAKLDAATGALLSAKCIGGSTFDQIAAIAVDSSGTVYFGGVTGSSNLPAVSAYQDSYQGGATDAFVGKISGSLVTPSYLTYLGGSGDDYVTGIAVDNAGDAIVTGKTSSGSAGPNNSSVTLPFPTTATGVQKTYAGGAFDAFVAELSPNGNNLLYSTYLGGNGDDEGMGIALDGTENIWVGGSTTSTNLPLRSALQQQLQGSSDGFITELSGGDVTFSTYLGGSNDDSVNAIATGVITNTNGTPNINYALAAGTTSSLDYPNSHGFQPYTGAGNDAFLISVTYGESASRLPDLAVTVDDKTGPATIGEPTIYTITITNKGPGDATNVMIFDSVQNAILSGVSPSQGFCSRLNLTTTCVLGSITAGSVAAMGVQVVPNTIGTITNTAAFVYADQTDLDSTNNSDSTVTFSVDTSGGYGAVSYLFLLLPLLGLMIRRHGRSCG
jgi:uncharacterized repeat protein (TIGR01451 family)